MVIGSTYEKGIKNMFVGNKNMENIILDKMKEVIG